MEIYAVSKKNIVTSNFFNFFFIVCFTVVCAEERSLMSKICNINMGAEKSGL